MLIILDLVQRFLKIRERKAKSRRDLESNPLLTQGADCITIQTFLEHLGFTLVDPRETTLSLPKYNVVGIG